MERIPAKGVPTLAFCACHKTFHKFCIFFEVGSLVNLTFRNAMLCAPCARAKAACKPFDMDRARRKAKDETARRAQVRKTKQQTDAEWKEQVLEKLGKVDELVVQVRRAANALEKLIGIESHDSDEELISWPESKGEETEVQENREKGKQREEKIDGTKEDENGMEGVKEGNSSFSLVAFSVGTRIL